MLKTRENVAATTQNKVKIKFKIQNLFSLIIFINDIEKFVYFSSTNDDKTMTRCEIIKIVYKINLNKTLKINEIINKSLRQLARVIIEQIHFLFDKCIKENIQSLHFKKIFIIVKSTSLFIR